MAKNEDINSINASVQGGTRKGYKTQGNVLHNTVIQGSTRI